MKLLLLFILSPFLLLSQTQIGNDIDGVAKEDNSGNVSISSDGTIVAIGGPGNDAAGEDAGHLRVFENISGTWTQIGNAINGATAEDNFGASVSISSAGTIVAIGAPGNDTADTDAGHVRVFENISGTWTQIGDEINGEAAGDRFGLFVSLSKDGTKLAIAGFKCCGLQHGCPFVGYTRIYENISGDWTHIGEEISTGMLGISDIELSADGSVVAIASPGCGIYGLSGYSPSGVKVYKNISGVWHQISDSFWEEPMYWSNNPIFGVSLTNNGSILAIGRSAVKRIYENISHEWVQIGEDIESEYSYSLSKISLSDDGTVLACSNSVNGTSTDFTRVYKNSSGSWIQLGVDINEEETEDNFGTSLELSGDGSTLAVGGPLNDGNEENAGHVRVYDLSEVLSIDTPHLVNVKLYPNPATNQFTIALPDSQDLQKVNIYTNLGQFIHTSDTRIVKTSHLASGLYYVEVITNKGKATKKLIVE